MREPLKSQFGSFERLVHSGYKIHRPFVNWQQKGLTFIRFVDYVGQAIGLNKKHLFA